MLILSGFWGAVYSNGQVSAHYTEPFQSLLAFGAAPEEPVEIQDFGPQGSHQSAVVVLANTQYQVLPRTLDSAQPAMTVTLEAYVDPEPLILLESRALSQEEDPSQSRFALTVVNARCDQTDCFVYMPLHSGGPARAKVERVLSSYTDPEQRPVQEIVVMAYNHARVGGTVFVMQDGVVSNQLNQAVYVCNMLNDNTSCPATENSAFCLASQTTPAQLQPCQRI